ncbi:MAG TPA: hypothetical protein VHZ09_20275 [Acidobacteriaceae bacterium]|jgi:hypothetical protein|nr:hypothetical protein [Acidobacteriaceae bacterium]
MATEQAGFAISAKQSRQTKTARRFVLLDKYFYFSMSLLIAAVVIYGFSHTVNDNLIHATPPRPWLLWVHGAVFSSWVVFFIFQSVLVRTHNVKVHRRTGWFGAGLAAAMTVLGISTAIAMDRFDFLHFHFAGAKTFFAIQLLDMVSFTTLFWLAVYWRKKPEFHRRLILIATCALTSAAFGRFPMLPLQWAYAGVDALILLGVIRDLIVTRRVHVVYRYALPLLVAGQIVAVQTWLRHPEWWVKVTNAIIQ